jgi:hypothetical protein
MQYDAMISSPLYEDYANLLLFAKTYNYVFLIIILIMSVLYFIILYFYLILFFKNNLRNIYTLKELNYSKKDIFTYITNKYLIIFSVCFLLTAIIFLVIKQFILERYFNIFYNVSLISDSIIEYVAYSFFLYIITLLMLIIFTRHYLRKGNYHD